MSERKFNRSQIQICICGGGNGAHVAAGFIASQGYRVNVLTRQPGRWTKKLLITTKTSSWASRGSYVGHLNAVSDDPRKVVPGSKICLVCAPAHAHPPILKKIAPHVGQGAWVGTLYGQGGFDWACQEAFGADKLKSHVGMIFGLQNIPWICKITTPGREARIIGPKQHLYVATYPTSKAQQCATQMADLFNIPTRTVPNFLTLTLSPSNQIIHPARYHGIFHDWDGKRAYSMKELGSRNGLTLYDDLDEFSAEELNALDNELQQVKLAILQRFPQLDLNYVLPLADRVVVQYGKDVKERKSLKSIFNTNQGYSGCGTPLVKVGEDQYIPNVTSRLFVEDIPYGLCILKSLAQMCGNFPTPRIDFYIRWHQQFMEHRYLNRNGLLNAQTIPLTGTPYKYNLFTLADVVATSLPDRYTRQQQPPKLPPLEEQPVSPYPRAPVLMSKL